MAKFEFTANIEAKATLTIEAPNATAALALLKNSGTLSVTSNKNRGNPVQWDIDPDSFEVKNVDRA